MNNIYNLISRYEEKIISRLLLDVIEMERILNKISPPTFMPKSDVERQRIIFLKKNALCCVRASFEYLAG